MVVKWECLRCGYFIMGTKAVYRCPRCGRKMQVVPTLARTEKERSNADHRFRREIQTPASRKG